MIDTMRRNRVAMINASQLQIAQAAGTPIIDVRPAGQYEAGFIQGSINVPLYQPIEGWEQRKILRRLGFALFGVFNGTEINPNFMQQLQEAAPDMEAGAVLICNLGGSMAPMGEHKKGQQSRCVVCVGYMFECVCALCVRVARKSCTLPSTAVPWGVVTHWQIVTRGNTQVIVCCI